MTENIVIDFSPEGMPIQGHQTIVSKSPFFPQQRVNASLATMGVCRSCPVQYDCDPRIVVGGDGLIKVSGEIAGSEHCGLATYGAVYQEG